MKTLNVKQVDRQTQAPLGISTSQFIAGEACLSTSSAALSRAVGHDPGATILRRLCTLIK